MMIQILEKWISTSKLNFNTEERGSTHGASMHCGNSKPQFAGCHALVHGVSWF